MPTIFLVASPFAFISSCRALIGPSSASAAPIPTIETSARTKERFTRLSPMGRVLSSAFDRSLTYGVVDHEWCRGHVDLIDPVRAPQCVGDRVHHGGSRTDRAGLARAFQTHGIGRRGDVPGLEVKPRQAVGAGHAVVHEARSQQLAA